MSHPHASPATPPDQPPSGGSPAGDPAAAADPVAAPVVAEQPTIYIPPQAPVYPQAPAYPQAPGYLTPAPGYPAVAAPLQTPMPPGGYPPTLPAPPSYDPALAAQMMAMMPSPYGQQPPARGSNTAVIVLSILLAIFVMASAAFGGLFVTKRSDAADLAGQVSQLTDDNKDLQTKLHAAERDLKDSDADREKINTERDAVAACLTAIYDWWDALEASKNVDTSETERLRLVAVAKCKDAETYL